MKKRVIPIMAAGLLAVSMAVGCSSNYKDGTYTAQSSVFEGIEDEEFGEENGDGYGEVTITVKDNKIVDCKFTTYMTDGTVKGEDYGKQDGAIANQDYYNKAQRAVQASQNYADQLKTKGELKEVDAISGATISYNEFNEAVKLALKQAK
ncbi:MAG: FMN-binding protein [Clostridium sp.]|nr:FMN-binding protein [Clostridium sp.]